MVRPEAPTQFATTPPGRSVGRGASACFGPADGTVIPGLVTATGGGGYDVLLATGETVHAVLRGRVKRETRLGDRVVIGDRVQVARTDTGMDEIGWAVEEVEARASQIVRRGPTDRRPKVIAANVDRMLAVMAAPWPHPDAGGGATGAFGAMDIFAHAIEAALGMAALAVHLGSIGVGELDEVMIEELGFTEG